MFLIDSFIIPGSREPDGRRRLETRERQAERRSGQLLKTCITTKRRSWRGLAKSNFEYRLGPSPTRKTTQDISEVLEDLIYDQRAGLRKTQEMCAGQRRRGRRADRCDYRFLLFSGGRRSLAKYLPGTYEPTPSASYQFNHLVDSS